MIFFLRKETLQFLGLLAMVLILAGVVVDQGLLRVQAAREHYRVYVAGIGIVEGKWWGETGVAIIGVETRTALEEDQDLKVIDVLLNNHDTRNLIFDADVNLVDTKGRRFGLKADEQPKVTVKPGTMSQGSLMINVPKDIPDSQWTLEIKGGSALADLVLPLKVMKVSVDSPD